MREEGELFPSFWRILRRGVQKGLSLLHGEVMGDEGAAKGR